MQGQPGSTSTCRELPCSSRCCLERVVSASSSWDGSLPWSRSPPLLNLTLFGNSVAMSNNFASTRTLIAELDRSTGRQISFQYAPSKGGVDASHERYCGLGGAERSQIFVIQYNRFRADAVQLLPYLRSFPQRALVLAVSHCAVSMFTYAERGHCSYAACRNVTTASNAGPGINAAARALASRRGVDIHVDLCAALRVLLHNECAMERSWTEQQKWPTNPNARFSRLYEQFYNLDDSATNTCGRPKSKNYGRDAVHLGRLGDELLGCLLARAVMHAAAVRTIHVRDRTTAVSPRRNLALIPQGTTASRLRTWCFSQDSRSKELTPTHHSPGWKLVLPSTGLPVQPNGAAADPTTVANCMQNKERHGLTTTVWRALTTGEKMEFVVPRSRAIYAEFYHHHSLNMGTAQVTVDGVVEAIIDTCCSNHCIREFPGQGFTYRHTIATNLLHRPHISQHTIQITALPSNTSSCSPSGIAKHSYQLDLFSLIGEFDPHGNDTA